MRQLEVTGAKIVFADEDRLPLAREAIKKVGLPRNAIYLIAEKDKALPDRRRYLSDLLEHGELDWERLTTLEAVSTRFVCSWDHH